MSGRRIIRLGRGTANDKSIYVGDPPLAAPPVPVKAVKRGLTKGAVINAFEDLHFKRDQWKKYLGDPPKWLKDCRVTRGNKSTSATWNPVQIAAALYGEYGKGIPIRQLDAVFVGLSNWREEWLEASALFRD